MMKSVLILLASLTFLSCSSIAVEKKIVSDIVHDQLASERYAHLKMLDIYLIETADNGYEALATYEYSRNYSPGINDSIWPYNSRQIKKLREGLKDKKNKPWTKSDIKNLTYSLTTWDTVIDNVRSKEYLNNPNTLIVRISRPVFIDSRNAVISFHSGTTEMGFTTIDRFTVLITKYGDKWVRRHYYSDGIYE